jgi:hypothetical protein
MWPFRKRNIPTVEVQAPIVKKEPVKIRTTTVKVFLKNGSVLTFTSEKITYESANKVTEIWDRSNDRWKKLGSIPVKQILYILQDEAIDTNMPGLVPSATSSKG